MKLTLLLVAGALAVPAWARAQGQGQVPAQTTLAPGTPTAYATEYDSLQYRAARVRQLTETRISELHSSFLALFGTSRRIKSFTRGARNMAAATPGPSISMVKKEITKHKSRSADVTKLFYYDFSGRLLLAELYQQGRLARQQLYEYPVRRSGKSVSRPFRTTEWVRGNYLSLSVRDAAETSGQAHRYYYTELRRPE